jgi:hypothetical protein
MQVIQPEGLTGKQKESQGKMKDQNNSKRKVGDGKKPDEETS